MCRERSTGDKFVVDGGAAAEIEVGPATRSIPGLARDK